MLEERAEVVFQTEADGPVAISQGNQTYLSCRLDEGTFYKLPKACAAAQIDTLTMPKMGHIRTSETERFWLSDTDRNIAGHGIKLPPTCVLRVSL
jgi:hypothetical protein